MNKNRRVTKHLNEQHRRVANPWLAGIAHHSDEETKTETKNTGQRKQLDRPDKANRQHVPIGKNDSKFRLCCMTGPRERSFPMRQTEFQSIVSCGNTKMIAK